MFTRGQVEIGTAWGFPKTCKFQKNIKRPLSSSHVTWLMRSCGHKTSATSSTVARPLRASNMASQEQNEWQPELTDEQILAFEQKIKDEEAEKVYYDIDN